MKRFFTNYALYFAWMISILGLICSVFFAEMLHYEPCRLCWYQRICLFPMVWILGRAAYKDDAQIVPYTLPIAGLGALLAFYQVLGIFIPSLHKHGLCGYKTDCSEHLIELWGFLSFPLVSLVGFILLCLFLWIARYPSKNR